ACFFAHVAGDETFQNIDEATRAPGSAQGGPVGRPCSQAIRRLFQALDYPGQQPQLGDSIGSEGGGAIEAVQPTVGLSPPGPGTSVREDTDRHDLGPTQSTIVQRAD